MSNVEFWMSLIGAAVVFGGSGYAIGYDGFLAKHFWTKCIFHGNPPSEYENWRHFCMSKVKEKVFIRAATKEDYR